MDRFGLGERVKYNNDWPGPDFPDASYQVPKGTCATVIEVFEGNRDCYLVRLDKALPGYQPEHSVQGVDLEPE
jgi:hypothetical protein